MYKNTIKTQSYKPTNNDESYLWMLASELVEPFMDFFLHTYKWNGIMPFKKSVAKMRRANIEKIQNPAAYFNKLLTKEIKFERKNRKTRRDSLKPKK